MRFDANNKSTDYRSTFQNLYSMVSSNKEKLEDNLNSSGIEGILKARQDRNEVRELDNWRKKMANNRNGTILAQNQIDTFTKTLKHLSFEERDSIQNSYKMLSLKQKMLTGGKHEERAALEEKKNSLFLESFQKYLKEANSNLMVRSHLVNTLFSDNNTLMKKISKATKLLNLKKQLEAESSKRLNKRLKFLHEKKNLEELKKLAITHSTSIQMISKRKSEQEMEEVVDIFEFDNQYKVIKEEITELRSNITQRIQKLQEMREKRELIKVQKEGVDRDIHNIKRSIKQLKKAQMDFLMHIVRQGLDCRAEGIVWMMNRIRELGGEIREDYLPEFLDEGSKKYLMEKLKLYKKLKGSEAMYKFYWDVFKTYLNQEDLKDTLGDYKEHKKARGQVVYNDYIVEKQSNYGMNKEKSFLPSVKEVREDIDYSFKGSMKLILGMTNKNYEYRKGNRVCNRVQSVPHHLIKTRGLDDALVEEEETISPDYSQSDSENGEISKAGTTSKNQSKFAQDEVESSQIQLSISEKDGTHENKDQMNMKEQVETTPAIRNSKFLSDKKQPIAIAIKVREHSAKIKAASNKNNLQSPHCSLNNKGNVEGSEFTVSPEKLEVDRLNTQQSQSHIYSSVMTYNNQSSQNNSVFSASTYICDQFYQLPYEKRLKEKKYNFSEICFEKGRNLASSTITRVKGHKKVKENDPFDMDVIFYDEETQINKFKSRKEFIETELKLEKTISKLQHRIAISDMKEVKRVFKKFTEKETKRAHLLKVLGRRTKQELKSDQRSKKLMEKLGVNESIALPTKDAFDFGKYLSVLVGYKTALGFLEKQNLKKRLNY